MIPPVYKMFLPIGNIILALKAFRFFPFTFGL